MHLWLEMWHQVSRTCAYAHLRLPSLPLFLSLKCQVTASPCRSQWDFDGHVVFCSHNSFECVSQFLCSQPGPTCCVHLILAQDIELKRKNVLHGSGARFLSTVRPDHSPLKLKWDNCKLSWCRRSKNSSMLSNTGKQHRIGGRSSGNDHSAGYDNSRLSLANAQGKLSVWQGHHSKHLRRQAEERLSGVGTVC